MFPNPDRMKAKRKLIELSLRRAFYKMTPLTDNRYKPRTGFEPYCERNPILGYRLRTKYKHICHNCRKTYNCVDINQDESFKCKKCGSSDVIRIGPIARIPRKNAHKKKWEEFFKHCGKSCAGGCR